MYVARLTGQNSVKELLNDRSHRHDPRYRRKISEWSMGILMQRMEGETVITYCPAPPVQLG